MSLERSLPPLPGTLASDSSPQGPSPSGPWRLASTWTDLGQKGETKGQPSLALRAGLTGRCELVAPSAGMLDTLHSTPQARV